MFRTRVAIAALQQQQQQASNTTRLLLSENAKEFAFRRRRAFTAAARTVFSPEAPDLRNQGTLRFDRFSTKRADGTLEYGNLLAMWVADMDFRTAPNIIQRLEERARQGVFGYPSMTHHDYSAVLDYLTRVHNTPKYDRSSIVLLPGLVVGLNILARAFAKEGEAIMMATPVYPPFFLAPQIQHRIPAKIRLKFTGGEWKLDMDAIKRRVEDPKLPPVKMFYLCNPHNPVGKVFSKEELTELLKYFAEKQIIVVSDEIHCDLVLEGKHISCAGLGFDDNLVVLHAPSKTFNLAGIGVSFALIPDPHLKARFKQECRGVMADVSLFGVTAMRAAYAEDASWAWQTGLIDYLRKNRDFLGAELERANCGVKFNPALHKGTYLAWLDCTELVKAAHKKHKQHEPSLATASSLLLKYGELAVNDGKTFFNEEHSNIGHEFVRLNFACPIERLAEAVQRIKRVSEYIHSQ